MPPDSEALRALLKQYIGPAYDRALRNTGSEERAREATRRAMELLKRSYEMGVEPNKALVLRITDDCCNESAFYNRQAAAPAQAETPAPQTAPAPFAAKAQASAPQAARPAPVQSAPFQAEFLQTAPAPATRAGATAQDAQNEVVSNPSAREKHKKAAPQPDRVSPGSALLVMGLSLIVVVLVVILVVMLASGGSSPGAAGAGSGFSAWFNAHIFPLF
ncbi:MAG: hypothetical protein VB051_07060 [Candidatus Pelethousia sp.]|nr:hypothetical protein [Candidatus Pelethousia sp.]